MVADVGVEDGQIVQIGGCMTAAEVVDADKRPVVLEASRSQLLMKHVLPGRMTIGQRAELTAAGPARDFGLYPAKGVIAVGSDADLAVYDPATRWRFVDGQSRAEWTPFDGWEMIGRTLLTIRRGTRTYRHEGGFPTGGGRRLRHQSDRRSQAAQTARQPLPLC